MNLKTTLVLLILVLAMGALFWFGPMIAGGPESSALPEGGAGTLQVLKDDLTADQISSLQVEAGKNQVQFRKGPDGQWTMPGNWPTRRAEVEQLVGLITGLRSRFAPIALGEPPDLESYGLQPPAVTVTVKAGEEDYRLAFGEADEADEKNRFSRPTYLRVDDKSEVVRLRPGLVGELSRPREYYQKRQLFPSERIAGDDDSPKSDRLQATALTVQKKGPDGNYLLTRSGDAWSLREPVHDQVDPDKLKSILAAVPDIWAEQFVNDPKKDLAEYGLKEPEETLRVTLPDGQARTLLIGKPSQTKVRTVTRPAPPMGFPQPPKRDIVHDEYRYAKLQDNDQVFEIKADKLKDVFVRLEDLRDPRLARFKTEDARRLEIRQGGHDIVLVKDKDRWRLEKPIQADAEIGKVTELLDKLSGLSARGPEVIDKADPKAQGFDKPTGTVQVAVEEEVKGQGDAKTKKAKTFKFILGKHDADQGKQYVKVDGGDRVNAIEDKGKDGLLGLVQRPALAYRGRRLFDVPGGELTKVEVQRPGETLTLEDVKGTWQLTAPVRADIDSSKASRVAGDLRSAEAVEYVADAVKKEDLDKLYGLAKPELTATVTFTKDNKPTAHTLRIGKQREGKQEYFARLDNAGSVFTVKKDLRDALDTASLAYRPAELWELQPEDIATVQVQRAGEDYRLRRDGTTWKIAGLFDAPASAEAVKKVLDDLAKLRSERYEAHVAKDLAAYGLDKPYLRVELTAVPDRDAKEKKPPAKPRVLLIGKPTAKDVATRFAKLGDAEAVFVVGGPLVSAVDHGPLDLLDRALLKLDPQTINRIQSTGAGGKLTLQKKGDAWTVSDSPAEVFAADKDAVNDVLGAWSGLRAERFAAYGPKADLAKFGLDKPAATVTVTAHQLDADKKDKSVDHTVALGKPVEGAEGSRYALVDKGQAVAVLDARTVKDLTRTYLDFVDRALLNLEPDKVTAIERKADGKELELTRKGDAWQMVKPAAHQTDEPTVENFAGRLANLRAERVAAYPAKDLKPFGLDNPAAVVTIRVIGADGKPATRVLRIGKVTEEKSTKAQPLDRFAQVEGSKVVAVLPGSVADRLLEGPLYFRDRNIARFPDADRAIVERGPRKATFAKVDGTWKLVEPVDTEAEHSDLEDFVNSASRLRADALVAEKPDSLKEFGLDKPEIRWRLQNGAKTVLDLEVGGPEKTKDNQVPGKEGRRRYARLAGGDLVFLLDPPLTSRVVAEYRKRIPWTASLDASQVERLTVSFPEQSFVLVKSGENWHVSGKPDVKVKTEAVNDTLGALAGLKAERFVVDKGADPKLYGLEPAQVVLLAQTEAGGRRVLQIGGPEGGSKRRYGRAPEGSRGEVFVISEADAAKLVRKLADFAPPASKPDKPK